MATKQETNVKPDAGSKPAAPGSGGGKVIGPTTSSPIKDGPSLKGECVGPKGAPYFER